jgi:hypothetical protein
MKCLLLAVLVAGSMTAKAQMGNYTGGNLETGIDNSLPAGRVFVDFNGHGHINEASLDTLELAVKVAAEVSGTEACSMWTGSCRKEAFKTLYIAPAYAQQYLNLAKEAESNKDGSRDSDGFLAHPVCNGWWNADHSGCGDQATKPQLTEAPAPVYPPLAARLKIQGVVVVSITVDERGNPTKAQVVRHMGYGLDQAALDL